MHIPRFAVAVTTAIITIVGSALAETPIKVGMSNPRTGPASYLGYAIYKAVSAKFDSVNASGGINGSQLELIALDDGYEPERTALNMRELISQHGVKAIIGNAGAPCAVVAVPIAREHETVLWGYVTGGTALRKEPPDKYIYNFRASLAEETSALVKGFVKSHGIKPEEIAFFTQRDAYGDSAFNGGLKELQRLGLKSGHEILHARYERNTEEVLTGLSEILMASPRPRALILAGARKPVVSIINAAKSYGADFLFGAPSFANVQGIASDMGPAADGIIVTQVVPLPSSDLPMAVEFRKAMQAAAPDLEQDPIAFEGYIIATIFEQVLRSIEGEITRATIEKAFSNFGERDIGIGQHIDLSSKSHQASHKLWLTTIVHGEVRPFQWGPEE